MLKGVGPRFCLEFLCVMGTLETALFDKTFSCANGSSGTLVEVLNGWEKTRENPAVVVDIQAQLDVLARDPSARKFPAKQPRVFDSSF